MDFQNRVGSAPGSGGNMTLSESNADRRDRLRKLALEMIDLEKDPYFMRNHLGTYECKLCLTIHTNEGNYLAHTQGKKHQSNLARRASREASENAFTAATAGKSNTPFGTVAKNVPLIAKIGRPGYKVSKIRDPASGRVGFLFQIQYPGVGETLTPRHRFVSSFEQRIEAPNKNTQYLVFVAEPYESIAFKMKCHEIDHGNCELTHWDRAAKLYTVQFLFASIQK